MIVLDCCAAVEITLQTEAGKGLAALILPEEEIISVDLLRAELASVFRKLCLRNEIERSIATQYLEAATNLVDKFCAMQDLQTEVLRESIRTQHSTYDLFYVILARRNGATLFTLDTKLIALCEQLGVDCIGTATLNA